MKNDAMLKRAKELVVNYFNERVEVTDNGDKGETYIDAYKKWENVCVPD